jgi:pyridoxal phosphate enzyme (YggS family)
MTADTRDIEGRYRAVLERVAAACERAGRPSDEVTVVAVSKAQPIAYIERAIAAGCLDFGENRVQEWRDKAPKLSRRIRWHFVGPLQSNKIKYLVDEISLVHSIDREKLVKTFEQRAQSAHEVLIEVNLGDESAKAGVAPDRVTQLILRCAKSPVVRPVGLMCIPPLGESPEDSRPYFHRLASLRAEVQQQLAAVDEELAADFRHLSMGMTGDFEVAVEEGATLVRVGTAIFGPRGG